VALYRRLGA